MDKSKERSLLASLAKERVVTRDQLANQLNLKLHESSNVVRRLQKRGLLKPVKRGVYAVVPLENDPAKFRPDPLLVAHAALGDSYAFSHYSALQLHGAVHNLHNTVHVSKPGVRSRRLKFGDVKVHVHGIPEKQWEAATTRVKRGRATFTVTTPERTVFDLVSLPPKQQDYEEVVTAYRDLKPKLSVPDLVTESMVWGNNTTLARMGHLLANHGRNSDDPFDGKMGEFLTLKSPYYFGTRPRDARNKLDKTFNVVYPEA